MMHLVATNLALWLSATTHETVADVRKKLTEERNETDVCHSGGAYYDKAVGFIYPCVVEYGLFGAGAAYIMYLNVGKGFSERTVVESDTDEPSAPFCDKTIWHKRCGRAYVGLIVGVVIMILTLIGVIVYHTASGNMEYTFLVMEILLIMIAASAGIFVYMLLRDLKYVGLEEDNFDGSLLIITQAGVYALYLFIMLGAINAIRTGDEFNYGVFFLVQSILCMGQSTLQTYTVLDGFSRSAHKTEHAEKKPGQNVITLLICVNFSMWMSATFLFANADDQDLFSDYFGIIPWSMITRMFSPLVIFYRFQASICLSDIWENAYKTRGKAE
ncbi:proton channel OtopLc-like [Tubulanus polymorphus]